MKAIITLGASASGKSTWTREFIAQEAQEGRVWRELNKDVTRIQMLLEGGVAYDDIPAALKTWDYTPTGPSEMAMKKLLSDKLVKAVSDGARGVVFSNTNIDGGVGALVEVAKHWPEDTHTEFKLFPTSFEVCLARDAKRTMSVGEQVLRMQFVKLAALELGFPSPPEPAPDPEETHSPNSSAPQDGILEKREGLLHEIGEQRIKDAERSGRMRTFDDTPNSAFISRLTETFANRTNHPEDLHHLMIDGLEKGWQPDRALGDGLKYSTEAFQCALELCSNPNRFTHRYLVEARHPKASEALSLLTLLIHAGADVNHKDIDGRTLLHSAAFNKSAPEVFVFLIGQGADPHMKNNSGRTPMDFIESLLVDGAHSAIERLELQKPLAHAEPQTATAEADPPRRASRL